MKKVFTVFFKCFAVFLVLLIVVAATLFDVPNLIRMYVSDKSGTSFESKYVVDESGNFIANIPYDEYLVENEVNGLKVYDIRDFGASTDADFKTNRDAINDAIKSANENGGGMVLVSGGKYSCANIELLSNVTLRIEKDSVLTNITYDQDKQENTEFHSIEENNSMYKNALIYANNAENITIEGPGRLEGNGATYCYPAEDSSLFLPLDDFNLKTYIYEHRKRIMFGKEGEMFRDFILGINFCKNVTVRNLEIYEAGSWTCRMENNENLLFERVILNNNFRVANTDGIDIMGGKNITIRKCFIATGDDAVCLKTDPYTDAIDNVLIEDCEITSLANCFKVGTATYHDVKNVTMKNCYLFMPGIAGGYAGIAVEATDGGNVSDIHFENIEMDHVTTPILVWLGYRHEGSTLSDVSFENLNAKGCDIASSITGYKKDGTVHNVENISLKNINVEYRDSEETTDIFFFNNAYEGFMNMGGYPESTRVSHMYLISHELSPYYDLPVYGLFVRNTDGITVENFNVKPRSCNKRSADNLDKTEKYNISNVIEQ